MVNNYVLTHREAVRKKNNRYKAKRRATTQGVLEHRMEVAVRKCVNDKNGETWQTLLGYTTEQLRNHLESLFTEGMTWERLVSGEIEIDHKKPRSLFNYDSIHSNEFKECWALSNLQPLWKADNRRKGDKYVQA